MTTFEEQPLILSSNRNEKGDAARGSWDFQFWVSVAFTLNYVIGSGFLTLPWAFEQAGILLGTFILLLFGFFSTISVFFILETMNRAEKRDVFHGHPIHHRYEITELCQTFLGEHGKHIYVMVICIYMYATLWAYTTVFANSFAVAHDQPFGDYSYTVFIILFSLMVVPVSLMEFSEQVYLQVSLSIFRVVMVIAMIVTIMIAYWRNDNEFQLPADYQDYQAESGSINIFLRAEWSQLYIITPLAAYSFIFHHSVPALAEPMTNKTSLKSLFQSALMISMVFYIALGTILSAYFGPYTEKSSNINWNHYIASDPRLHQAKPFIASIIRLFVLIFPAVDVASAFPLNAFTLGNNIMTAYYGKAIHDYEGSRWRASVFRLLAAIPPIFGALLVKDLGVITSWAGLTGFALVFIFPPVLSYVSKKDLDSLGIPSDTIHSSYWTSDCWKMVLGGSGVFLLFYVGYVLVTTPSQS